MTQLQLKRLIMYVVFSFIIHQSQEFGCKKSRIFLRFFRRDSLQRSVWNLPWYNTLFVHFLTPNLAVIGEWVGIVARF